MRRPLATGLLAILIAGPALGRDKKSKTPGTDPRPATAGCTAHDDAAAIWWSPRDPVAGAPLRILAV